MAPSTENPHTPSHPRSRITVSNADKNDGHTPMMVTLPCTYAIRATPPTELLWPLFVCLFVLRMHSGIR